MKYNGLLLIGVIGGAIWYFTRDKSECTTDADCPPGYECKYGQYGMCIPIRIACDIEEQQTCIGEHLYTCIDGFWELHEANSPIALSFYHRS